MNILKDKVALITGAGSKRGMGHAIAVRFAKEGAKVTIVDKEAVPKSIWPGDENWGGLNDVLDEIKAVGGEGVAVIGDVSSSQDVDKMVAQALEKYGKIDILVSCVGIRGPMATPVAELDEKVWRNILDVNLTGSFLLGKAVAKHMLSTEGEGRKMVFISSLAGLQGYRGSVAYCASKHGLIGLAKTLAVELAERKINVNVIAPGAFETNLRDDSIVERAKVEGVDVAELVKKQAKQQSGMAARIPFGMGQPSQIADLVLFLVSDQSYYITGEVIRISGGAN